LGVPVSPHSITSFPARDFVVADGYAAGERVTVNVLRGGFTVGTAAATADSTGLIEVNHGIPGDCFSVVTPDIRGGDVIQVVTAGGVTDETRTAGVTVTQRAAITVPGTVTIHGDAASATGGRIPIAELEARVVAGNQNFVKSGKRTVRADWTGTLDGTLVYDGPGLTTWTATFTGMGQVAPDGQRDDIRAVANESRGMWNGPSGTEITIYESGGLTPAVPGSAPGCLVPFASGPSVDLAAASDSGISKTDNVTNITATSLGGVTGLPTATSVDLYVDGALKGNRLVDAAHRYSFTGLALTPGKHTVTVGENDPTVAAGRTMGNAPLVVTVDVTKPVITRIAPVVNAVGVKRLASVGAIFNEPVNTVYGGSFALRKASTGGLLTAVVTYAPASRIATLNPSTTLLANTVYTATLSSPLQDVAGNRLVAKVWSFKTGTVL